MACTPLANRPVAVLPSTPRSLNGGAGMPRRIRPPRLVAAALAAALLTTTGLAALPADAATGLTAAADYCGGRCSDILPPGENGNATLADILGNKMFGTRPAHTDDQLGPYRSE